MLKDNLLMMWSNEIPSDVARLCDFLCGLSSADGADLQEILEELNMRERLSLTLVMLKKELRMFELQRELAKEVEAKISTNQRKYFLHEQLKQIKRELGIEKVLNIICTCTHPCFLAVMVCVRLPQDDKEALIAKFQERLSARDVPDAIQKVIDEETAKLNTLETASSEFNVTRYCRYYEMLQLRARQLS